ncbi:hypothetical protein [Hyalangium gracile]|uniref:hypothetical protein n=1 Tax=Hyalangium gracile TaxID=394092 RepID=UPI001CCE0032|nr:hypothetical protein [Hyalangium gracile]
MNRLTISLMVALALVTLGATPAAAQQPELGTGERPWAKGVPQDKQTAALALFRDGNFLLKNSLFPKAVEKYREALKLWDHPAIHYNMALALLNLNEPIALHSHLVASMRYGEAPLDADKFERARTFKTLVESQLSHVDISCEVPGTTVMMNGQVLFKAPGRHQGFVVPGPHTFSATREGYPRNDRKRTLAPGEKLTLPIKLYTDEELTRYTRHWASWKSWAVLGAGAAVAAGGGLLHLQARDSFDSFDAGVLSCGGCMPDDSLASKRSRGDTLQKVAVGSYAAGGAALLTGMVLLYVNRAQPYRISPDELEQAPSATPEPPAVSVTPIVGGGEGGVLATFRF